MTEPASSKLIYELIADIHADPLLHEWREVIDRITPKVLIKLLMESYSEADLSQLSHTLFQEKVFFNDFYHFIQLIQKRLPIDIEHPYFEVNLNLLAKHYFQLQLAYDEHQWMHTTLSDDFMSPTEQALIAQHQHWLEHLMTLISARLRGVEKSVHYWKTHLAIDLESCPLTRTLETLNQNNTEIINPIPPLQDIHKQLHLHTEQLYYALRLNKLDYIFTFNLYQEIKILSSALESQIKAKLLSKTLYNIYTDPLTGVHSRLKLSHDLKQQRPQKFALINIAKFGQFNAAFGLESGDLILKHLANTLNKSTQVENVYHLYADVFAIVLHSKLKIDYETFLKDIEIKFNQAPEHPDYLLELSLSYCEFCEQPLPTCEYGLMALKEHGLRLIDAKQLSEKMKKRLAHTANWVQKIKLAIADSRLVTVYQPILNLKTGLIEKYECLMRIEEADGQLASPADFLPILEKMFLYHEASRQMLWQAFETFSKRPESFSVNLSLTDIKNPHLLPTLKSLSDQYPETAQRCVLELLENEAFEQAPEVESFISKVRTLGFQIAIDDFGSGYSNFAYLFQMPLDFIKLDGSLIQNINDPKIATLCEHVIEMAHNMKIKVIAEFVSSETLLHKVTTLRADFAQGYAIGKPERDLLPPQIFL